MTSDPYKVPFLDLRVPFEERQILLDAVDTVLQHGRIMLGPEVNELEKRVASYIGVRHAIGVNSGTDALILAIRALGVGTGDEVITTPLSFVATANAIRLNGAIPVFADIDDTLNLDPHSIEPLITPKTKAVIPVHWSGKVCCMEMIIPIAEKHGLTVIEDASQAFGAERHGRKAGTFGELACFSMNSMKPFASLGEAGIVVTNSIDMRSKLEALRYNGLVNREICQYVSNNSRMDTIQAALLLKRLNNYSDILTRRRKTAEYYSKMIGHVVEVPACEQNCFDIYYTYQIKCDRRDELQAYLAACGIETKVQHKPLMPNQPAYVDCVRRCPNAERLIERTLCLPVSEKVTPEQREFVASSILTFYGK